jgi:putative ABC transport system permease protein
LERYQEAANVLTLLLFAFSVPVISLVLTFVILVVALNVERQHSQVAMLRSRGATAPQVLGIAAVESGLLGVLALVAALPLSMIVARAIGQTRSFLDFSIASDLRVGLTWGTLRFGVAAVALALAVQVVPMLSSARHTVVTYKTERARRLRPPWWQRVGLDVLLMVPAAYGAYLLNQQGTILANAGEIPTDPFQNPLLFLVPALSLLAATLLVLRLMPLLMRALAWLGGLTKNVGSLMAVRQLARAPGLYAAPLALLILTLGLSTYSASLAATLDNHLYDQHHYWVGADVSLVDTGDSINAPADMEAGTSSDALRWRFLPVSEYRSLRNVQDAGRVGRYEARVQTAEGFRPGTYLGVDRTDFADVAFWRDDFAAESLGGLMNLLALRSDAILLPGAFMTEHVLSVGDTIQVAVRAYDQQTTMPATIVGGFDYFPSWYPDTGPLVVGNLDYFFQEAQMQYPYRVWLEADPAIDFTQLEDDLWELNFGAQAMVASRLRILEAQRQPQRQGLLGLLSVGFGAASVLTALGFVLYTLFSFRRRSVEIGVLRAVGLSKPQMIALVASELAILLVLGAAAGTGLGIWASRAFVPALQIGAEMTARVPPFVVEIAWPALFRIYALFALLFLVALAVLIRLLMRMKLFQAIKLGETI